MRLVLSLPQCERLAIAVMIKFSGRRGWSRLCERRRAQFGGRMRCQLTIGRQPVFVSYSPRQESSAGMPRDCFWRSRRSCAIQRLYGPATADARIAFAFRGALSGPIRNWLRRAEQMLRTMKANTDIVGNAASSDLANRLRHLVDCANAAMLRRSRSHHLWAAFHSAVDDEDRRVGPVP